MATGSQAAGHGSIGEGTLDVAYVLEGSLLETCDRAAGGGMTQPSVAAWRIETGCVNGVDVSGQVVLVLTARRAPGDPFVRVILVDEWASPERVLALVDAFRGHLGGPLAAMAGGEEQGFCQVPIEYRLAQGRASISVPGRLRVVARFPSADLDQVGRGGCASEVLVELPQQGLAWHDNDVPARHRKVRLTARRSAERKPQDEKNVHRARLVIAGSLFLGALTGWLVPPVSAATPALPAASSASAGRSISAGRISTCALRGGGSLACWGDNTLGQASPPPGTFRSVSAASSHACALRADDTIVCWGYKPYGETPAPLGTFVDVSAGASQSCGVRTGGALECWRYEYAAPQFLPPPGVFGGVSTGTYHACGLRADGTVACWGDDYLRRASPPPGAFLAVTAGGSHSCGLRTDHTLACWGDDDFGKSHPPAGTFTALSAGGSHSCGLRTDGTPACWGSNRFGQASPPGGTLVAVSAGANHSCGMRSDGTVVCWGWNRFGQSSPLGAVGSATSRES